MTNKKNLDAYLKKAIRDVQILPAQSTCLDVTLLANFLDGFLSQKDEERIEKHLAQCHFCRQLILSAKESEGINPDFSINPAIIEAVKKKDITKIVQDPGQALEKELFDLENELGIANQSHQRNLSPYIMVVDDDENYLASLNDTLKQDYTVIPCNNGDEALAKMNSKIKTVIMDIKMPGLNGFEVAKKLRQSFVDFSLIFNTGYPGEYSQQKIQKDHQPFGYATKDNFKSLMDFVKRATTIGENQPSFV